jgi:hypothetical protein
MIRLYCEWRRLYQGRESQEGLCLGGVLAISVLFRVFVVSFFLIICNTIRWLSESGKCSRVMTVSNGKRSLSYLHKQLFVLSQSCSFCFVRFMFFSWLSRFPTIKSSKYAGYIHKTTISMTLGLRCLIQAKNLPWSRAFSDYRTSDRHLDPTPRRRRNPELNPMQILPPFGNVRWIYILKDI